MERRVNLVSDFESLFITQLPVSMELTPCISTLHTLLTLKPSDPVLATGIKQMSPDPPTGVGSDAEESSLFRQMTLSYSTTVCFLSLSRSLWCNTGAAAICQLLVIKHRHRRGSQGGSDGEHRPRCFSTRTSSSGIYRCAECRNCRTEVMRRSDEEM